MIGLAGLRSVAALDGNYGNRWRSPSERQYYWMRNVIIDEIMGRVGNSLSGQEATKVMVEGGYGAKACARKGLP